MFGFLYLDELERNLTTISEGTKKEEIEETQPEEGSEDVVCDFEVITENVEKDQFRFHYAYASILDPNPNLQIPYGICKETLKDSMKSILEKNSSTLSDPEYLLEQLQNDVKNNRIEYLIDNTFVIYTFGQIWTVDFIDESIDLLWEAKADGGVEVSSLSVISEYDSSKMFFLSSTYGLGGITEEDFTAIERFKETVCKNKDIGTWMYDTTTQEVTMVAESEDCL